MMTSTTLARSGLQAARSIARTSCTRPVSAYGARAFATSRTHWNQASTPPSPSSTTSNDNKASLEQTPSSEATGVYGGLLRGIAKLTGHYTVSQTAMRSTHNFYEICAMQLGDKRSFWIDTCGLPDNFQTWFSVTHLHVWLLMVRIRAEKNGKVFQQQLVNHFFHDIEDRMRYNHKVNAKGSTSYTTHTCPKAITRVCSSTHYIPIPL
ncbi:ubiquinol-cytochrome C chaperone-domain-containing protein [Mortierella sp. GBAus27b]|nr:ubiquinol-cytochrome C chaperone-domain-containing protein [Mortierella sp. GBAus27b]